MNHAAISPNSLRLQEQLNEFLMDARLGTVTESRWIDRFEQIRTAAAKLVGCDSDEIAFVNNTSTGAGLIANGIHWQKGDNIIVPWNQFPANVYPWLNLKARGVNVRTIELPRDETCVDYIMRHADKKTRLVALSYVEFADGFRHEIKKIGELCHQRNILMFVDAIQGLGAINFDFRDFNVDFMAVSGHKWLLGPFGAGLLTIRKDLLDAIYVSSRSWLSAETPWAFYDYDQPMKTSAARFEGGTPNLMGFVGLGASIDMILEIGIDEIERRILHLTDLLLNGLSEKNYFIITNVNSPYRSGIVTFKHSEKNSTEIFEMLTRNKVIISERNGNLRVSPHFYNSEQEIFTLLDLLP